MPLKGNKGKFLISAFKATPPFWYCISRIAILKRDSFTYIFYHKIYKNGYSNNYIEYHKPGGCRVVKKERAIMRRFTHISVVTVLLSYYLDKLCPCRNPETLSKSSGERAGSSLLFSTVVGLTKDILIASSNRSNGITWTPGKSLNSSW